MSPPSVSTWLPGVWILSVEIHDWMVANCSDKVKVCYSASEVQMIGSTLVLDTLDPTSVHAILSSVKQYLHAAL